jgi:hypothetical protein
MSRDSPDRTEESWRALGAGKHDEILPEIDEATQERLGRLLARDADQLVRQPMPDVFLSLLAKLEAKEQGE